VEQSLQQVAAGERARKGERNRAVKQRLGAGEALCADPSPPATPAREAHGVDQRTPARKRRWAPAIFLNACKARKLRTSTFSAALREPLAFQGFGLEAAQTARLKIVVAPVRGPVCARLSSTSPKGSSCVTDRRLRRSDCPELRRGVPADIR
jgi:hypothetical protein